MCACVQKLIHELRVLLYFDYYDEAFESAELYYKERKIEEEMAHALFDSISLTLNSYWIKHSRHSFITHDDS